MHLFRRYQAFRRGLRADFAALVEPLLRQPLVQQLDGQPQHMGYTRLRHSLDVAYLSFFVTRLFGWHCRETARAALLHDLFFHSEGQHAGSLLRSHPQIALQNARSLCDLTAREEDIILRHMWLLTLRPPRYREGFVVTFVDKYCAAREFAACLLVRRGQRSVFGSGTRMAYLTVLPGRISAPAA